MDHLGLKEKAYYIIREKLMNHEIKPGERIMENLLAEEISMSRTPVREAINRLCAEGFIINVPRKGIFAASITKSEFSDMIVIREALEVLAVQLCIQKISDEQIEKLEEMLGEYRLAYEANHWQRVSSIDSNLHKEIAKITGNKKLMEYIFDLEDFMCFARGIQADSADVTKRGISISRHQDIIESIKRRDIQGAVEAIKVDVRAVLDRLDQYILE